MSEISLSEELNNDRFHIGKSKEGVPEDASLLSEFSYDGSERLFDDIAVALKNDQVVVLKGLTPGVADSALLHVTQKFGLQNQLKVHSGFASSQGHRKNVGQYYMSVNQRSDFQFIPAHSEGTPTSDIQIASFYCYENSTDGGETILLQTDQESAAWSLLKELTIKVDLCGRKLSPAEIAGAKMLYQINFPQDLLTNKDQIVAPRESPIPVVKLYDALVPSQKGYSKILSKQVNVYWDTVASIDFDSGKEYLRLLRQSHLLREPPPGFDDNELDNSYKRRVWRSGVGYDALFKSKLTKKLAPGEMVILNNMTWTHSTNNWTPGSGTRKVVAGFA